MPDATSEQNDSSTDGGGLGIGDRSAPILIFDSGVGGLSVLGELRKTLPNAPIIYAADSAALPYGNKSEAEIAARVAGLLGRMSERYRPRLICIACNTASTIALGMVREVLEVPIVGTVPAIKPAAEMSKSGVIGLLGTEATIRQNYVDQLEAQFASDKQLIRHAAPGLVALAESKLRGEAPDMDLLRESIAGLIDHESAQDMDVIVLACTHFPLLSEQLQSLLGPKIRLIDGAQGIARRIAYLTKGQERLAQETLAQETLAQDTLDQDTLDQDTPDQDTPSQVILGQVSALAPNQAHDRAPNRAITTGALSDFQTLSPILAEYQIYDLQAF